MICVLKFYGFLAKHKANPLKNPQGDNLGIFFGLGKWQNYSAVLRTPNFSLIRADLPERSRK